MHISVLQIHFSIYLDLLILVNRSISTESILFNILCGTNIIILHQWFPKFFHHDTLLVIISYNTHWLNIVNFLSISGLGPGNKNKTYTMISGIVIVIR